MDTYMLIDKNNYVCSVANILDAHPYFVNISCYHPCSWAADLNGIHIPYDMHYAFDAHCKWDSCTHWYFRGEDYDPEIDKEFDSYYHLCGSYCFQDHIRNMCFAWKLAADIMIMLQAKENDGSSYTHDSYYESPVTQELIKIALDGCRIMKFEEKVKEK